MKYPWDVRLLAVDGNRWGMVEMLFRDEVVQARVDRGTNTSTIPYLGAGLYPLSLEIMQDLFRDPKTRDKVSLESTQTNNASTMHDMFVVRIKDTGRWKKAVNAKTTGTPASGGMRCGYRFTMIAISRWAHIAL